MLYYWPEKKYLKNINKWVSTIWVFCTIPKSWSFGIDDEKTKTKANIGGSFPISKTFPP